MNLDRVRDKARRCEEARNAGAGTVGAYGWAAAAIESAADVPALIAEIERLREENAIVFRGLEASTEALAAANENNARALTTVKNLIKAGALLKSQRDEARASLKSLRARAEQ